MDRAGPQGATSSTDRRRGSAEGRPTVADIAAGIHSDLAGSQPGLLALERKSDGHVIGYCGLIFDDHGALGEPELAYELLRRAHGFGYATEAGLSVVAWSTATGCERLWATVRAWNVASRRVLEKLGFRETGQVDPDTVHGDSVLTVRELSSTVRSGIDDPGTEHTIRRWFGGQDAVGIGGRRIPHPKATAGEARELAE